MVRIRVPSPYPSKNGRIRTLIFLCLCLFFSFDAFKIMKERCKAKVTAKSKRKTKKQQQSGLLSLAEVCFSLVLAYLFSIPVLAISFSLLHNGQGSQPGPVPTFVVSRSLLVVTQSGSDPAARHGSVPRTDAIY